MTEFVLTATFILIPLFLAVPLLGKYIDMRSSTIAAARYAAWESTVSYGKSNDLPEFFNAAQQPIKSAARIRKETKRRVFSRSDLELRTGRSGYKKTDANPLWVDHTGRRLDKGLTDYDSQHATNARTPDPTHVFTGLLGTIDVVFEAIADVMSAVGIDSGFTVINTHGYAKADVKLPVAAAPEYGGDPLFGEQLDLTMHDQAAVLSDGWNAGGTKYARSQVEGLVPTSILNKQPFTTIQSIAAALFASPELSSGSLKFGYINFDAVPPDRLEGQPGGVSCDGAGRCSYD